MRWTRSRLRPEGGFTLIELLVVVLIIGILIAVSAPAFLSQTQKAQDSASKQYLAIALKAARSDAVDNPAGQGLYRTGATLASAIQASEPELTVQAAASACPSTANGNTSLTDTTPTHVWIDTTQSSTTQLVMCNDPTHSVWTVTADQHSAPVFTVVRNVTYTSSSGSSGSSSSAYSTQVTSDGAVAYWRLGESSGTTAVDAKGLQNGTYSGAVTLGASGALPNDSNTAITMGSGYVSLGQNVAYNPTHAFSAEVWVKLPSGGLPANSILLNNVTGGAGGVNSKNGWTLTTYGTNQVLFQAGDASYGYFTTDLHYPLVNGAWNHVVATYDGAGGAKVYVNGQLAGSGTFTTPAAAVTPLTVGSVYPGNNGGSNATGASFDEVAIYPTALAAGTVATHYGLGQSLGSSMYNGGFETPAIAGSAPSGWTITPVTGGDGCEAGATTSSFYLAMNSSSSDWTSTANCSGTAANSGGYSLFLRPSAYAPSGSGAYALSPAFTSAGGTATFWAKGDNTSCSQFSVDVTDAAGNVLRTPYSNHTLTAGWAGYTISMSGDAGQQRRLRLFGSSRTAGSGCGVFFDDFSAG